MYSYTNHDFQSLGVPRLANTIHPGRLLLFDPSSRTIVEAASNVREIRLAALSGDELTILFGRNRRLVLATFDSGSLAKRGEQVVVVGKYSIRILNSLKMRAVRRDAVQAFEALNPDGISSLG